MRINNNVMALNAHRQLSINQSNASKSMEKSRQRFEHQSRLVTTQLVWLSPKK